MGKDKHIAMTQKEQFELKKEQVVHKMRPPDRSPDSSSKFKVEKASSRKRKPKSIKTGHA